MGCRNVKDSGVLQVNVVFRELGFLDRQQLEAL